MSKGRSPDGSGSHASHEAANASSPEASIPNAVAALQFVPKAVFDQWGELDLGEPQHAWACAVDRFREEARINRQSAEQMQRRADDAWQQADVHTERALEFEALAKAMERAPVTFPASAIEARSDATTKIGAAEGESATGKAGDAQRRSHD